MFWLKLSCCTPQLLTQEVPHNKQENSTVLARTQNSPTQGDAAGGLPLQGPAPRFQPVPPGRVGKWGRAGLLTGFAQRPFWSQGSKLVADILRFSTDPLKTDLFSFQMCSQLYSQVASSTSLPHVSCFIKLQLSKQFLKVKNSPYFREIRLVFLTWIPWGCYGLRHIFYLQGKTTVTDVPNDKPKPTQRPAMINSLLWIF